MQICNLIHRVWIYDRILLSQENILVGILEQSNVDELFDKMYYLVKWSWIPGIVLSPDDLCFENMEAQSHRDPK